MHGSRGFTLIEVMSAMVIFTGGVLMVLRLSETLQQQLSRSAVITEMSSIVRAQVDSLDALGYASLAVGQTSESLTVQGRSFQLTREVTQYSPLVRQLTVARDRGSRGVADPP